MYEYRATLLRVVDGDTVHLAVDLGFDTTHHITGRLLGINTPELPTPEGKAARQHLLDLLSLNLLVHTVKDRREKYGRYLVTLWRDGEDTSGPSINQRMVDDGHAQPYSGEARRG